MPRTIDTRGDRIIDSREVIARFEELSSDRDTLQEAVDTAQACPR